MSLEVGEIAVGFRCGKWVCQSDLKNRFMRGDEQ